MTPGSAMAFAMSWVGPGDATGPASGADSAAAGADGAEDVVVGSVGGGVGGVGGGAVSVSPPQAVRSATSHGVVLRKIIGAVMKRRTDARGQVAILNAGLTAVQSARFRACVRQRARATVSTVRVLLVEDSERVAQTVGEALRGHGHSVVVAGGVVAADEAFGAQHFDIAVVDVGLPDGSGLEWCRATRRAGSQMPILMLTARDAIADRVRGLDAGADDYLGKPFAMDELLARARALCRRGPRWAESVRRFGSVVVDSDQRTVTVDGQRLPLTAREHDVVAFVSSREGRVVLREELLEAVWGESTERAAGSLEVLLVRIRRKLAERGVRDALRTVRHVGYTWSLERSKRV